jgi:hypothetical protein
LFGLVAVGVVGHGDMLLLRCPQALITQTTVCNRHHTVDEPLAAALTGQAGDHQISMTQLTGLPSY